MQKTTLIVSGEVRVLNLNLNKIPKKSRFFAETKTKNIGKNNFLLGILVSRFNTMINPHTYLIMTPSQIFEPYAKNIYSLKEELLVVEQKYQAATDSWEKAILKKQRGGLKRLINSCIRETGDFIPTHVSKAAKKYCDGIHPNEPDLIFEIPWIGQADYENKSKRDECNLKYEHKIPVDDLIEKVMHANSFEEIVEILKKQEIVWIQKGEDTNLPRKHRPDSDKAYHDAGIEVIKNPNSFGHIFKK